MSKIPVTSSHVNITGLHPRFRQRLEAFFADPRIKGKVAVVSGTRTYAQQAYLYKYKSGRGTSPPTLTASSAMASRVATT